MTNVKDLGHFSFHSLSYDIPEALIHRDILYVVYLAICLGQRRGLLYIKFGVPTKSDLLSAKLLHKTGAYVPSQLKDPNCAVN